MNTRYYITTKRIFDENPRHFRTAHYVPLDNRHPDKPIGPDDQVVIAASHTDHRSADEWKSISGVEALPDPLRRLPVSPFHHTSLKHYAPKSPDMFDVIDKLIERHPLMGYEFKQ